MATGDLRATDLPAAVDEWVDLLKGLVDDVRAWAESDGWETRLTGRDLREADGIRYEVPALVLDRGEVEVALVPVARDVPDADGLVDLYLMPDFDSVASLYRQEGQWSCHYGFHLDPRQAHLMSEDVQLPLDEANLRRVLEHIAAHA